MFVDIQIVTPPVEEPVTLADGIAQLRSIQEGQEARLQEKLIASRQRCEKFTRRSLITQDLDVWYDTWDGPGVIEHLPRGTVQSVLEVATYDDFNTVTVIDPATYNLIGTTLILPWLYFRPQRGIRVRIRSGYGDPEDVPALLKEGILEYAAFLYENRVGEGPEAKYSAMTATNGLPQGVYDKWKSERIEYV